MCVLFGVPLFFSLAEMLFLYVCVLTTVVIVCTHVCFMCILACMCMYTIRLVYKKILSCLSLLFFLFCLTNFNELPYEQLTFFFSGRRRRGYEAYFVVMREKE